MARRWAVGHRLRQRRRSQPHQRALLRGRSRRRAARLLRQDRGRPVASTGVSTGRRL